MKLRSVHIRMFRNILDSSQVAIEETVTCHVGKNESGNSFSSSGDQI
jgi:predicted ATP-dependent endonuclease of OLD family